MESLLNTDSDVHYHNPNFLVISGQKNLNDNHYKIIEQFNYCGVSIKNSNIIDLNKLPLCVKTIDSNNFIQEIPKHIIEIHTVYSYDNLLNNLPDTLKKIIITFNTIINQNLLDNLPYNLESLIIKGYYNGNLDYLPSNLKILKINLYNFNQALDNLPNTLEELYIEGNQIYSHNLLNLPDTLKILSCNIYKIGKIDSIKLKCPTNLEYLSFSNVIDIDLFPYTLETVIMWSIYDEKIMNTILSKIPKTIKKISLNYCLKSYIIDNFIKTNFKSVKYDYI